MMKIVALSAVAAVSLGASATTAFAGDAAAGEALWRNCRSCHSITAPDGTVIQRGGRTGPNLYGLEGRAVGSQDGFRYSQLMQDYAATGAVWTEELFTQYVADPNAFLHAQLGITSGRAGMNFRLASGAEDMWAYLESVSN